jgi:hypothetical protein
VAGEWSDRELLTSLIRRELVTIPIDQWGFFFPCLLATWRFIEKKRPGTLAPAKGGFDTKPYFEGRGARWFMEGLTSNDRFVELLEAIMYPITRDAPERVRDRVMQRGFFLDEEVPEIPSALVDELAAVTLVEVDRAVAAGSII